jgi:hypothetical protein
MVEPMGIPTGAGRLRVMDVLVVDTTIPVKESGANIVPS